MAMYSANVAAHDLLLWHAWQSSLHRLGTVTKTLPIDRVIEMIDTEMAGRLIVPELAKRVGLSQNVLARRFKQTTGSTVSAYILARRIAAGHVLLTTTDLPVKVIAGRVGLPDPHHFNKQFRRLTGQSPTAVRIKSAKNVRG